MEENTLMDKVAKLPDGLRMKVADFIDHLLAEQSGASEKTNKPVFGSGKGMFKMMPGFDEPLEDFKDYM